MATAIIIAIDTTAIVELENFQYLRMSVCMSSEDSIFIFVLQLASVSFLSHACTGMLIPFSTVLSSSFTSDSFGARAEADPQTSNPS